MFGLVGNDGMDKLLSGPKSVGGGGCGCCRLGSKRLCFGGDN